MKLLFFLFLMSVTCFCSPLSAEPVKPGPRDRCPVCGMFVAPFPAWLAQIEFKDGSREFFDGPKDMFRFYLQLPENNSDRSRETIEAVYVTEYYSTKMLRTDTLFFVAGSDIRGPMGNEFIPISSREAAETFKKDHKGSEILTFEQVTPDILSSY